MSFFLPLGFNIIELSQQLFASLKKIDDSLGRKEGSGIRANLFVETLADGWSLQLGKAVI